MAPAKPLSVSIERPAAQVYEFLCLPENFPRWASVVGTGLHRAGADWLAETPEGPMTVCFSERNSRGVLDHAVRRPSGASVYVPLRVVGNGERCDLVLTLFRRPGMSEQEFAADSERAMRDLLAARQLLEARRP